MPPRRHAHLRSGFRGCANRGHDEPRPELPDARLQLGEGRVLRVGQLVQLQRASPKRATGGGGRGTGRGSDPAGGSETDDGSVTAIGGLEQRAHAVETEVAHGHHRPPVGEGEGRPAVAHFLFWCPVVVRLVVAHCLFWPQWSCVEFCFRPCLLGCTPAASGYRAIPPLVRVPVQVG
eukprot:scaffold204_cov113-Isochrysis_galbana.AAC.6